MVLQKVVEENHVEVTDTLIDDNNAIIKVGAPQRVPELARCEVAWGAASPPSPYTYCGQSGGPHGWRGEAGGGDSGQTLPELLCWWLWPEPLGHGRSAVPKRTSQSFLQ